MTALIMKDIATLKKTLLLTIAVCIGLICYGIYENELIMIPLVCAMVPLVLTAIVFGYDIKSNFEQFAFSMPIKRSSYVVSKLFFSVIFGILGAFCMCTLLLLKYKMNVDNVILIATITLAASVLMSAIQLPFVFKYGAEKGRLVMIITYFAIFALSSLLKEKSGIFVRLMGILEDYSVSIICLVIASMSMLVIGIAVKISIMIMERKEY